MNTLMFEHPLTEQHLRVVTEVIGYNVVGPIGKKLACGDVGASLPRRPLPGPSEQIAPHTFTGPGAMTEWRDIVQIVVDRFHLLKRPAE